MKLMKTLKNHMEKQANVLESSSQHYENKLI